MNADFLRIARRDKRAFLNEQCKETEEDNTKGKSRGLFKKIGDVKGTFRAKMDMIKDKNGRDLTEAEDIKKRWQEHTEKLSVYIPIPKKGSAKECSNCRTIPLHGLLSCHGERARVIQRSYGLCCAGTPKMDRS